MPKRAPRWTAVALVLVIALAAGAFAVARSLGGRPGARSSTEGPGGSPGPWESTPSPTATDPPLLPLLAQFHHRSGFPFDLRYPSSWGEERLEASADFGEYSWISPIPGLFQPGDAFSDPLREASVSDPARVIGVVVADLHYGYDRATFERDLHLASDHPIGRSQITVDEAQDITADRIEGTSVDGGGSGLTLRVVGFGYPLTPEGDVWAVIVFLASEGAFTGDAAGGALFDAIAATIAFDQQEIQDLRSPG